MPTENNEIGKRIIEKRESLGLSQEDLVKYCRVNINTIQEWENGLNIPSGEDLFNLTQVLKTNSEHLIYGDEDYVVSSKVMGNYIVTPLVILALFSSMIIIFSGFNSLAIKAPISSSFLIIASGAIFFCVLYWMAAILNSVIINRVNNELILKELIKLNKNKNENP